MQEPPKKKPGREHNWRAFKEECSPIVYRFGIFLLSAFILVASNVVIWLIELAFRHLGTTFFDFVAVVIRWTTSISWVVFNVLSAIVDMVSWSLGAFDDVRDMKKKSDGQGKDE